MATPSKESVSSPSTTLGSQLNISRDSAETVPTTKDTSSATEPQRDWKFWAIIFSITLALFNAALELTLTTTALATIVADLHGEDLVWVGSAYALTSTALVPTSGGLAQVFGRKSVMLGALTMFAAGSAICGAAKSMDMLIAGRAIQGVGGGGIASLTQIILSDLVSLKERGKFNGLVGLAWGVASGIGPIIGGALADAGQWRWIFYLSIPLCGITALFVGLFLSLKTPPGTMMEKLQKMDWIGNFLVISSTSSVIIALTWGGSKYAWSSARVVVPLVLGLVGLCAFFVFEFKLAKAPMVSPALMSTRTGISGYLQTFFMPIVMSAIAYYMPLFFQACYGSSAIMSGVLALGYALTNMPAGIVSGVTVAVTQKYRPQLWIAWILLIIGVGLFTTFEPSTPKANVIGFQIILSIGIGMLATTTYFPVLAPLDVSLNAPALALFTFFRNFAQVWGVTIGGTVLSNGLNDRLPSTFLSQFPEGTEIALSLIPMISGLDEPVRTEVRQAFAHSLNDIWKVLIGIGGMGFLSSLLMKALPLHTNVDDNWGVEKEKQDVRSDV